MAKSKSSKQKKSVAKPVKKSATLSKKSPLKAKKIKTAKSIATKKVLSKPKSTGSSKKSPIAPRGMSKGSAAMKPLKVSVQSGSSKQTKNYKNFLSPLENRLFLKLVEQPKVTASGLYLPDTAQRTDGFIRGEVLAVGPGRKDRFGKLHRVGVDVGETVILTEHAGTPVMMEGQNFIFVRESDIVGVVE